MAVILVLLTFIVFLTAEYIVGKLKGSEEIIPVHATAKADSEILWSGAFSLPQGIFFHPGHTWAELSPSGEVKVGIDDFFGKISNGPDELELPARGEKVKEGEPVIMVKMGGNKVLLPSPVEGQILEHNWDVFGKLSNVKDDPYGKGWLFKIMPKNLANDLSNLIIAEKSVSWLRTEVARLREFLTGSFATNKIAAVTLPDGGIPVMGVLRMLDKKTMKVFEENFLRMG